MRRRKELRKRFQNLIAVDYYTPDPADLFVLLVILLPVMFCSLPFCYFLSYEFYLSLHILDLSLHKLVITEP